MKARVSKPKSSSQQRTVQRKPFAGAAMVPPAYGLSFIDRQPIQRKERKTSVQEIGNVQTVSPSPQLNSIEQPGETVQLVRATSLKNNTVLDVVYDSERISLNDSDGDEIGYVTFSVPARGIVAQGYIHVEKDYRQQDISYLLCYLGAEYGERVGHSLLYLGGGSLSPSGALLAKKFSFNQFVPKKSGEKGGCCAWLASWCCGSNQPEEKPLLKDNSERLLTSAYQYESQMLDGNEPQPLKWLPIADVKSKALEKITKSWKVEA
jgi:hypothetical protein